MGWQKLRLDARTRTVTLLVPNMRLDLGGLDRESTCRDHRDSGKLAQSKTMHHLLLKMDRFPTRLPSYRCSDRRGR